VGISFLKMLHIFFHFFLQYLLNIMGENDKMKWNNVNTLPTIPSEHHIHKINNLSSLLWACAYFGRDLLLQCYLFKEPMCCFTRERILILILILILPQYICWRSEEKNNVPYLMILWQGHMHFSGWSNPKNTILKL
jgi:hypothetical protein